MRKKNFSNRQISLFIILSLLLSIILISLMGSRIQETSFGKILRIFSQDNIPLREISGSYLFRDNQLGKNFLYTIGDASSEISISEVDLVNKKVFNTYLIDIKKEIIEKFGICTSSAIRSCQKIHDYITKQWEAIYVDPQKRIYLLNETLGTILIFNQDQKKITNRINLKRFTFEKVDSEATLNLVDENSLGEGFLPLNNGHILVAKQNYPPSLIEFGPKDSKPKGFDHLFLIDETHSFPLDEKRLSLEPLKIWVLPPSLKNCDLSELIYSKETGLNLLSQKCQVIFELENPKLESLELTIKESYKLPRSLMKAEAFITLPKRGEFLVFEDNKNLKEHNFFFLTHQ